ncbi:TonB-linked outer membrane protein, SusC/RagA family [bacterium A37T11]|nr:TonB-linked outer membrane protein, SusC/RagA family [bacterium A37T11]
MKQILRLGEGYALTLIKRYVFYGLLISIGLAWLPDNNARAQQSKKDSTKSMQDTVFQLDEVEVSTGYQTIPKERATGSFVHIDSALFNRAVSTDVIRRLKGITPSLLFDERAGGTPKLSIRGISTIYGNAKPLIVVDNFPYEGDLSNLNPNDIADVSILRDAAAASIWGIRAGNGVIVITTKRGKLNQPITVGFNSNVSVSEKPDLFYEPKIASADFIGIEQYLYDHDFYKSKLANTTTFPVISPAVEIIADARLSDTEKQQQLAVLGMQDIRKDISRYFYRGVVRQQYALNLQGGGARHSYYYAADVDRNQQSLRSDTYNRINLTARNQFNFFQKLSVQTALELTSSQTKSDNTLISLQNAFPYQRLADDVGNPLPIVRDFRGSFAAAAEDNGRLNWQFFPLEEPENRSNQTGLQHYRASLNARYALLKDLHVSVSYQYEHQATFQNYLMGQQSYFTRDLINRFTAIGSTGTKYPVPLGDILDRTAGSLASHNGRGQLDYAGDWDDNRSQLNLLAGFEVRQVRSGSYANRYYGYDGSTGTAIPTDLADTYTQYPSGGSAKISAAQSIGGTLNRFRSYYVNGSYTYLSRYTLSGSARMDQTNLFGVKTNQRSIPLWSTGIKWDMNKESFYKLSWLPTLSLRWSYGYNGNFDETAAAYVVAQYVTTQYGTREARLGNLPNPELKGERTAVNNLGLDFASRNQRVSGRFDLYFKRGKDLIGNTPYDATTGRNTFRGNVARMKGHGWDAELNSLNVHSGRFSWRSNLFWSYTADKVVDYRAATNANYYFSDGSLSGYAFEINPLNGRPLFGVYSYPWAGLDPQTGDPQGYLHGQVSKDYALMLSVPAMDSLQYHGRATPSSLGSFRNSLQWGSWSLSANVTWKLGYYFRRAASNINYTGDVNQYTSDYAQRWQQPGDELHTQIPSVVYPQNANRSTFYQQSAALVDKGDHVRLQDIQLSYDLPAPVLAHSPLSALQIYAYASNLGILWRANNHHIDPDYNSNPVLGNTTLPAPKTLALGIKASFR